MDINIGKGITLAVDANALPAEAMAHVVYIGLRNVLMDSHAGVTRETDGDSYVENSRATAEKKLAALMAGQVRVAGTREGDPVRAEAIRIATGQIMTAWRKVKKPGQKIDPTKLRAMAVEFVAKKPELMELAAKRVAEAKAIEADVDVAGL